MRLLDFNDNLNKWYTYAIRQRPASHIKNIYSYNEHLKCIKILIFVSYQFNILFERNASYLLYLLWFMDMFISAYNTGPVVNIQKEERLPIWL